MFAHRTRTRRTEAYQIREEAAQLAAQRLHPDHLSNGEELEYRRPAPPNGNGDLSYIANYSKALPHNRLGEVRQSAYRALLRAIDSRNPDHFEQIPLGRIAKLNLTNPQAGFAFDLEGPDAQAVTVPPAPRIDSAENSAEMAELYWMALLRDVSFIDYGTGANTDTGANRTQNAIDSLNNNLPNNNFTDFRGPKAGVPPRVTAQTLFRGFPRGALIGPYVSQFLLKGTADPVLNPPPDKGLISYGTLPIDQRQKTLLTIATGGRDHLTRFATWLAVQRGRDDRGGDVFDLADRRFIRNLRDLANYVHFDALYEAYLNACLILLGMPARVDPGNPYVNSRNQDGFGTFGNPHILTLLTEVATRALKAVWFQKWGVHRRLRPEEFGGRIHVHLRGVPAAGVNPAVGPGRYPMINGEILNTNPGSVLARINTYNQSFGDNTFLLPQVFPEGAPTHPAYGAGHATVGGACVTVLKAWFDESDVFDPDVVVVKPPNPAREAELKENRRPKVPNANGTALDNYVAPAGEPKLTVGGELNKLAANISLGRNAAGVHWRSDYTESIKLGEEIAIRILQEQKLTYNEDHHLSLTKFDGTAITI